MSAFVMFEVGAILYSGDRRWSVGIVMEVGDDVSEEQSLSRKSTDYIARLYEHPSSASRLPTSSAAHAVWA